MRLAALFFAWIALCNLSAQLKTDNGPTESEISLMTRTGSLSGSLTLPVSTNACPLVLIIAGSGPTDRDCNSTLGIQTNTYKMLAADFAKNGIATLRFDKRGIGKSQSAMTSESELRFETYIQDAIGWIQHLKSDYRFSGITILGHSEGSLIGLIAAAQGNVNGFISVAGVGRPADKVLQDQLKTQLPLGLMNESNKILDSLKAGKTVTKVDPSLMSLYRPGVQPYMISWFKYNPEKEIAKLKIPILIVQGTTDLQVTVEDARLLSAAKPDAKICIIENMNHVLKESDNNMQTNLSTYTNPNLPLKAGLVNQIVSFVKSVGESKKR